MVNYNNKFQDFLQYFYGLSASFSLHVKKGTFYAKLHRPTPRYEIYLKRRI